MKLVAAGIALLLLGSASADAGIFGIFKGRRLPEADRFPIVRPKWRDDHKQGMKRTGRHPDLIPVGYGNDGRRSSARHHPIPEYLYQAQ